MRLQIVVFSLLAVLFAETTRAEALAPPGSLSDCLSADVQVLRPLDDGQALYRIAFLNRCELPRSFFWCAEHPSTRVPTPVACRSQRGFGPELRHSIQYRKEFQWHLPPGARIRFQDCPSQETPTREFGCASIASQATRR